MGHHKPSTQGNSPRDLVCTIFGKDSCVPCCKATDADQRFHPRETRENAPRVSIRMLNLQINVILEVFPWIVEAVRVHLRDTACIISMSKSRGVGVFFWRNQT